MKIDKDTQKKIARAMHNLGYEIMPSEIESEVDMALDKIRQYLISKGHHYFVDMPNEVFFEWLFKRGFLS